jgi:hypothetical protein
VVRAVVVAGPPGVVAGPPGETEPRLAPSDAGAAAASDLGWGAGMTG